MQQELDSGADPNSGDRYTDSSPLFIAAGGVNTTDLDPECVNTVRALIEAGGGIDRRERDRSLLAEAAGGNATPELIDLLVEHGADVCAPISEHLPERVGLGGMSSERVLSAEFDWLSEYAHRLGRAEMGERLEHYEQMCS